MCLKRTSRSSGPFSQLVNWFFHVNEQKDCSRQIVKVYILICPTVVNVDSYNADFSSP